MRIKLVYLFMFAILCVVNSSSWAMIVGPYNVDANTLHLWHLDESGVSAVDQAHYNYVGTYTNKPDANQPLTYLGGTSAYNPAGGTAFGLATLGNNSFFDGLANFGTCVDTSAVSQVPPYPTNSMQPALNALPPANGTADNVDHTFDNPNTHAFTMEAIIKISFDPAVSWAQPQEIISGEGDAGDSSDRSFQFRIEANTSPSTTAWRLRFQKVSGFGGVGGSTANYNLDGNIPSTGPNAIEKDGWYHVAVTYNGNLTDPASLKLYWTKLDQSHDVADLLASGNMNGWLREQDCDFAIGNEARDFNGETEPFNGRIDEVRISDIARGAGEMMFIPEPATSVMALLGILGMGLMWFRRK
jgi:hypothetical protein